MKLQRQSMEWIPPAKGNVKINFGGASRGNAGSSGGGGICRDETGKTLFAYTTDLQRSADNTVELEALLQGLKIAKETRLDNIEVEGDSKIVIEAMLTGTMPNSSQLRDFLQEALDIANIFHNISFKHVFMERNRAAEKVANQGIDMVQDMFVNSVVIYEEEGLWDEVKEIVNHERLNKISLRQH